MNAVDVLRQIGMPMPHIKRRGDYTEALDRLARLVDECKRLEWVSGRDEFEQALAAVLGGNEVAGNQSTTDKKGE